MKKRLLFATRSAGKAREIRQILGSLPYEIVFPDDIGLYESVDEATVEDAATFSGNAQRKAEYFVRRAGMPTVAEDSGLEVFSLGGAPGVRSRRFALATQGQDEANNAELLRRLAGASPERRTARYRCSVVFLAHESALPVVFEGECRGRILKSPCGTGGFGYDPLFFSDDLGVCFGEASFADKDAVSHRGRALRAFAEWLLANPL
ncbi:MAG: non-canonical purine NTP pyrophosphatase [Gemmatimonadales bacterium]